MLIARKHSGQRCKELGFEGSVMGPFACGPAQTSETRQRLVPG
jgi:hypothetical protein